MCGRYGRRADKQRIAEWAQTHDTNVFNDDDTLLAPSYNIAPQTVQPVVILDRETGQRASAIEKVGWAQPRSAHCVLLIRCVG
jgi:putative SOS response-associated peptidase YedK